MLFALLHEVYYMCTIVLLSWDADQFRLHPLSKVYKVRLQQQLVSNLVTNTEVPCKWFQPPKACKVMGVG